MATAAQKVEPQFVLCLWSRGRWVDVVGPAGLDTIFRFIVEHWRVVALKRRAIVEVW